MPRIERLLGMLLVSFWFSSAVHYTWK